MAMLPIGNAIFDVLVQADDELSAASSMHQGGRYGTRSDEARATARFVQAMGPGHRNVGRHRRLTLSSASPASAPASLGVGKAVW